MKFDEWRKIAKGLRSVYTSDRFMPDNDAVKVWYVLLKDLQYEDVARACKAYMLNEHFPPTVADIRKLVVEISCPAAAADWCKAWDKVVKAMGRYGSYGAKEAMKSFDDITRRCVEGLGGFTQLCKSENTIADRAHFQKAYEQIQANALRESVYTPDLKKMIEAVRKQKIEPLKIID